MLALCGSGRRRFGGGGLEGSHTQQVMRVMRRVVMWSDKRGREWIRWCSWRAFGVEETNSEGGGDGGGIDNYEVNIINDSSD